MQASNSQSLEYFCTIYSIPYEMYTQEHLIFVKIGRLPKYLQKNYAVAYTTIMENYYPNAHLVQCLETQATFCLGTVFDLLDTAPRKQLTMSVLMSLNWLAGRPFDEL